MRKLTTLIAMAMLTAVPASFAASGPLPQNRGLAATPATPDAGGRPLVRDEAERRLKTAERRAVRRRQRQRDSRPRPPAVQVPPHLQAIAQCESGGNPRAIGGGGQFRGKYQFTVATWAAVGGKGDPAAASEAEQDRRAVQLYAQAGPGQWPVCSQ